MYANEEKINKLFLYWLVISLILVFSIIIIGGLTRLTDSGLSITEWELFIGVIPPLNKETWIAYFEAYKKIPQYKYLNFDMTIEQFKIIFYWEYFHRILARLIGLFFLIPLVYFYFTKKIKIDYLKASLIIFILIILQGIIGWYMVKSGLTNDITVSHYRLSIHLITAILIISSIFWLIKNFIHGTNISFFYFSKKNIIFQFFIFLIYIQIIIGALVSGLDAGRIYQTWPLMGETYFPSDSNISTLVDATNLDNHSLVQFYHRNLAYMISLYGFLLALYIYKNNISKLFKSINILLSILVLQIILGIYTLVSGLNLYFASLHQITSVLLVLSALNLYYFKAK